MPPEITLLLQRWQEGDESALHELTPLVYGELHRVAQRFLRNRRSGETLQPTAMVNEAYLKLVDHGKREFANRAHFMALMARVMRQVLIDHARAASSLKRGGKGQRVEWDAAIEIEAGASPQSFRVLDLDRALEALALENPKLADTVEMHYFAGMTDEQIAAGCGRSAHVVRHELRLARAWLRRKLA